MLKRAGALFTGAILMFAVFSASACTVSSTAPEWVCKGYQVYSFLPAEKTELSVSRRIELNIEGLSEEAGANGCSYRMEYVLENEAETERAALLLLPEGGEEGDYPRPVPSVTVDGEEGDLSIHHTVLGRYGFYPENDREKLSPVREGFFTEETPVGVYRFRVDGLAADALVGFECAGLASVTATKVLFGSYAGQPAQTWRDGCCGLVSAEDPVFTLYVFGEPLRRLPAFEVYDERDRWRTEGEVVLEEEQDTTLGALVGARYEEGEVSYPDFLNGAIDLLNDAAEWDFIALSCSEAALSPERFAAWRTLPLLLPPFGSATVVAKGALCPDLERFEGCLLAEFSFYLSDTSDFASDSAVCRVESAYPIDYGVFGYGELASGGTCEQDVTGESYLYFGFRDGELPSRRNASTAWLLLPPVLLALAFLVGTIVAVCLLTRKRGDGVQNKQKKPEKFQNRP